MHAMAIVAAALVVHAPQEVVYSLSQDISVRSSWDKFTTHMDMADGSPYFVRLGSRVVVRAKPGVQMTVEFTQIDAPNRVTVRMVDGPHLLEHFTGTWIFEKVDDKATLVHFDYDIAVRKSMPGVMRAPLQWLAEYVLGKIVLQRLAGLKRYGEHVAKLRNMPPPLRNFTL
jgi:ribosome-associated toxin RatA of RatAB toxin-antitoxin module